MNSASGNITQKENKRIIFYFLPNTFTALNMACGFTSIILSWRGEFYQAALVLILGAIFDSVDGRVARLTGTQSSFGEQFDSLSDLISFGMAPALLIYNRFLLEAGRLGLVISFIFVLCGALRLARFNSSIEKVPSSFFQGLPIPGAAIAIVGYVLISLEFTILDDHASIPMIYTLFYALLMISNIPFNSFKDSRFIKNHKKSMLMIIFILLALVFIYEQIMVVTIITLYVVSSIIYFFLHKGELKNVFEWKNE